MHSYKEAKKDQQADLTKRAAASRSRFICLCSLTIMRSHYTFAFKAFTVNNTDYQLSDKIVPAEINQLRFPNTIPSKINIMKHTESRDRPERVP